MPSTVASSSESVARPFNQTFKNTKVISAVERAEKNAKRLCYFCDQSYEREHKCSNKKTQLFLVEIPREANEEDEGCKALEGDGEPIGFEMLNTEPCLSLQAIIGVQGYQIMRITGHHGKKPIQILIDSGSTNNFLDVDLTKI